VLSVEIASALCASQRHEASLKGMGLPNKNLKGMGLKTNEISLITPFPNLL